MATDLTLVDLATIAARFAEPDNDCCTCGDAMPGVLAPQLPDGDDAHPFVQRCDTCDRFDSDDAAAEAIATVAGLSVRRRFDDAALDCWRPFLARPGSPDDRDTFGEGGDEMGCWPEREHPVPADAVVDLR